MECYVWCEPRHIHAQFVMSICHCGKCSFNPADAHHRGPAHTGNCCVPSGAYHWCYGYPIFTHLFIVEETLLVRVIPSGHLNYDKIVL